MKRITTCLVAALAIAGGSLYLSTPVQAAAGCNFTVQDIIDVSDSVCGGGSWSASNIQCDGDSASWDLSCNAS